MRFSLTAVALACITVLGASPVAAQAPDGQAVYRENCRVCHGPAGRPAARMVTQLPRLPSLADSTFMRGRSEDSIVAVVRRGAGRDMKGFKDTLSPEEMAAVARYIKGLGAQAPRTP